MRLNRFLSMAGVSSRRKGDELIKEGRISLNGSIVTELGTKVDPSKDIVKFEGKIVAIPQGKIYILLYKPVRYLTTLDDPHNRRTVKSLLGNIKGRIYPIGRLDFNTEGLLLFTNDGKLTHRLLHPKYKVKKTYWVEVEGVPSDDNMNKLRNGIKLEDGMTTPAQVDLIEKYKKTTLLQVIIREGRKRQIRRMCDAIGHPVVFLKRTHFDKFHLGNLKPGEFRRLNKMEVNYLRKLVGLNIE